MGIIQLETWNLVKVTDNTKASFIHVQVIVNLQAPGPQIQTVCMN